jgi:hypothetical protein
MAHSLCIHSFDLLVRPTAVATRFHLSNIVIKGLYPTRGMNVRVLSVFVMSLVGRGPAIHLSPTQGVLPNVLNDVHILRN